MRRAILVRFVWAFLMLTIVPVMALHAREWTYLQFEPGQSFRYSLTTERGLKGWVQVDVAGGENGAMAVTVSGDWMGTFKETATLMPGMTPMDFLYSFNDFQIPNAAGGILNVDSVLLETPALSDGSSWTKGNASLVVNGTGTYSGRNGAMVTVSRENAATGRTEERVYCVDPSIPLPVYARVPAANDTWTYELQ